MTYLREHPDETLLVHASRADGSVRLPAAALSSASVGPRVPGGVRGHGRGRCAPSGHRRPRRERAPPASLTAAGPGLRRGCRVGSVAAILEATLWGFVPGREATWATTPACGFASSARSARPADGTRSPSVDDASAPSSRPGPRPRRGRDGRAPHRLPVGPRPPANPAGVLQSYVSHLRRRLEPDAGARTRRGVIASAGPGYALRVGPDAVDAWRFENAVQAATDLPRRRRRPCRRRCTSGAARRTPSTPTSRGRRRRSSA